jgi:hypothetical protein
MARNSVETSPVDRSGPPRGRPKDTDEALLYFAAQCRALGINATNLLDEAVSAELSVRRFEKENGQSLPCWDQKEHLNPATFPYVDVRPFLMIAEMLKKVPQALTCWRVRDVLLWLRELRMLRRGKSITHDRLLLRAAIAISDPGKIYDQKVEVWRSRAAQLSKIQALIDQVKTGRVRGAKRDALARTAGFGSWEILQSRKRTLARSLGRT